MRLTLDPFRLLLISIAGWMSQMARDLSNAEEGFLVRKRYLIHDRDPLITAEFLETLGTIGVQSVKLAPPSPKLNVHAV